MGLILAATLILVIGIIVGIKDSISILRSDVYETRVKVFVVFTLITLLISILILVIGACTM
jgi:hypothetical protein